jgi:hypothetical protein
MSMLNRREVALGVKRFRSTATKKRTFHGERAYRLLAANLVPFLRALDPSCLLCLKLIAPEDDVALGAALARIGQTRDSHLLSPAQALAVLEDAWRVPNDFYTGRQTRLVETVLDLAGQG